MTSHLKNFFSLAILIFLVSCQSSQDSANSHPKNITTLAPLSPFDRNTVDGLLVSVADQAILLSDLQHAILATSNGQTQISANGKLPGGTMTAVQANQLLESIINQKVLQIKALELGIDVSDAELSARINDFLKQQNYNNKIIIYGECWQCWQRNKVTCSRAYFQIVIIDKVDSRTRHRYGCGGSISTVIINCPAPQC